MGRALIGLEHIGVLIRLPMPEDSARQALAPLLGT